VVAVSFNHPIGFWGVCSGQGSVQGCVGPWTTGLGGPDAPHAVDTDRCDLRETLRVGADNAVHIVERDRDTDDLRLVRRITLPQEPPWGEP
jgi:hypothetical protein